MKKLSTMLCCICLAIFGAVMGLNNKSPAVTANAAPVFAGVPLDLRMPKIHYDTIYVSKDTVMPCNKRHYPKVKVVRKPYAVHDTLYVPVLKTVILRVREEISQSYTKYGVVHDTIQTQKTLESPDSVSVTPVEYIH